MKRPRATNGDPLHLTPPSEIGDFHIDPARKNWATTYYSPRRTIEPKQGPPPPIPDGTNDPKRSGRTDHARMKVPPTPRPGLPRAW